MPTVVRADVLARCLQGLSGGHTHAGAGRHVGQVTIRGKRSRIDQLPLPVDAGQAIAAWLRGGRPGCSCRQVFTTLLAPLTRKSVAAIVKRAARRAGLEIAKRHASPVKHAREVHAYRHWVPALGIGAARLVAADPQVMTIRITALPGQPADGTGDARDHHRQAGALLRLLHDAEPARPLRGFQRWLDDRISWWLRQSASLLSAEDQRVIDHHLPPSGARHPRRRPRPFRLPGTQLGR